MTSTASSLLLRLGAKPPSSPTAVPYPRFRKHSLQVVEDLDAHAQAVAEAGGSHRHDHELLEVDVVVGMGAAVEDVHHGHRQQPGIDASQIAIEGLATGLGGGPGHGQRHRQKGVGAHGRLVGRPVQLQHLAVDFHLPAGIQSQQRTGDALIDVGHRLLHAFAQIARGDPRL